MLGIELTDETPADEQTQQSGGPHLAPGIQVAYEKPTETVRTGMIVHINCICSLCFRPQMKHLLTEMMNLVLKK